MTMNLRGRLHRLDRRTPPEGEHVRAMVVSRSVGCEGLGATADGPDVEWVRTCPGAPTVVLRLPAEAIGSADPTAFLTPEQRAAYDRADEGMVLL
jgi:hypothetical protein